MIRLTAICEGRSQGDIELALQELLTQVRAGNTSGINSNDSGNYTFAQQGEDDSERLERAGWEYDGQGWSKEGQQDLSYSYKDALNAAGLAETELPERPRLGDR